MNALKFEKASLASPAYTAWDGPPCNLQSHAHEHCPCVRVGALYESPLDGTWRSDQALTGHIGMQVAAPTPDAAMRQAHRAYELMGLGEGGNP